MADIYYIRFFTLQCRTIDLSWIYFIYVRFPAVERCTDVAYISWLRSLRVTLFFVLGTGKLTMHTKINIRLLSVAKANS